MAEINHRGESAAPARDGGMMICCDTCPFYPTCEELDDFERDDDEESEC